MDVEKIIRSKILLPYGEADFPIDDCIEMAGFDSLDEIELIMSIEDEFNIRIEDKDAESLETLRDVVLYVESNI